MREIITLQFGDYASHVGCHLFNLEQEVAGVVPDRDAQEGDEELELSNRAAVEAERASGAAPREVDVNVLFRSAADPRSGRRVYAPRLVAFGQRGFLGSVPGGGTLEADEAPEYGGGGGYGGYGGYGGGARADLEALDESNPALSWHGDVAVQAATPLAKSPFLRTLEERRVQAAERRRVDRITMRQRARARDRRYAELDGNVRYWTDYMRFHLHPKNVFEMPGHTHNVTPFDYFNEGAALVGSSVDLRDEMADSVRVLAEECDSLQGFQILVDSGSGWAGAASRFLEDLRDDYNYAPFLVAGCAPRRDPAVTLEAHLAREAVNRALLQNAALPVANLYVPLSAAGLGDGAAGMPGLDASQWYHTSAVLAAGLHTATRPYRAASSFTTLHGYAAALTPIGAAKAVAVSALLPAGEELAGAVDRTVGAASDDRVRGGRGAAASRAVPLYRARSAVQLSPELARAPAAGKSDRLIAEWAVLCGSRGLETPRISDYLREARVASVPAVGRDLSSAAAGDFSGRCWEPFLRYLAATPCERREATYGHDPVPVPLHFPPVFEPEEGDEDADDEKRRDEPAGDDEEDDDELRRVGEVISAATVFSAPAMHRALAEQAAELRRYSRVQSLRDQFDKHGMQQDDWSEAVHALENLGEAYRFD